MKIQQRKPGDLIPYENNPRVITDDAIDGVAESIRNFGFRKPIVVDENDIIIAGHTRRAAALKLGLKSVPTYKTTLTAQQAASYRLVDNRTGELTGWNWKALAEAVTELGENAAKFLAFSFDDAEIEAMRADTKARFDAEQEAEKRDAAERAETKNKNQPKPQPTNRNLTCPNCGGQYKREEFQ